MALRCGSRGAGSAFLWVHGTSRGGRGNYGLRKMKRFILLKENDSVFGRSKASKAVSHPHPGRRSFSGPLIP